jgi:hypothetical protein
MCFRMMLFISMVSTMTALSSVDASATASSPMKWAMVLGESPPSLPCQGAGCGMNWYQHTGEKSGAPVAASHALHEWQKEGTGQHPRFHRQ